MRTIILFSLVLLLFSLYENIFLQNVEAGKINGKQKLLEGRNEFINSVTNELASYTSYETKKYSPYTPSKLTYERIKSPFFPSYKPINLLPFPTLTPKINKTTTSIKTEIETTTISSVSTSRPSSSEFPEHGAIHATNSIIPNEETSTTPKATTEMFVTNFSTTSTVKPFIGSTTEDYDIYKEDDGKTTEDYISSTDVDYESTTDDYESYDLYTDIKPPMKGNKISRKKIKSQDALFKTTTFPLTNSTTEIENFITINSHLTLNSGMEEITTIPYIQNEDTTIWPTVTLRPEHKPNESSTLTYFEATTETTEYIMDSSSVYTTPTNEIITEAFTYTSKDEGPTDITLIDKEENNVTETTNKLDISETTESSVMTTTEIFPTTFSFLNNLFSDNLTIIDDSNSSKFLLREQDPFVTIATGLPISNGTSLDEVFTTTEQSTQAIESTDKSMFFDVLSEYETPTNRPVPDVSPRDQNKVVRYSSDVMPEIDFY